MKRHGKRLPANEKCQHAGLGQRIHCFLQESDEHCPRLVLTCFTFAIRCKGSALGLHIQTQKRRFLYPTRCPCVFAGSEVSLDSFFNPRCPGFPVARRLFF